VCRDAEWPFGPKGPRLGMRVQMDLYHCPRALSSQFEPRIRVRLFGQQLLRKAAETRTAELSNAPADGPQAAITGERNSVFRSFGTLHESLQDSEEAFGFGVESF
jgi:hypothetical protein